MTRFFVDNEEATIRKGSERENRQKLISILKRVVESREQGAFGLASERFDFEILPLVPDWRKRLIAVAHGIRLVQEPVNSLSNEMGECQTHDSKPANVLFFGKSEAGLLY